MKSIFLLASLSHTTAMACGCHGTENACMLKVILSPGYRSCWSGFLLVLLLCSVLFQAFEEANEWR